MWFFGSARSFHSTRCRPTRSSGFPARPRPTARRRRVTTRRRSAENQQLPGADRLADQPEDKAVGLQRPAAEESRRGPDSRRGSGDSLRRVEVADLHHRGVKVASTVTSRILVEGGFSMNIERYTILAQPGITKDPARRSGIRQFKSRTRRSGRSGTSPTEARTTDGFPIGTRSRAPSRTSPARTTSRSACRIRGDVSPHGHRQRRHPRRFSERRRDHGARS